MRHVAFIVYFIGKKKKKPNVIINFVVLPRGHEKTYTGLRTSYEDEFAVFNVQCFDTGRRRRY